MTKPAFDPNQPYTTKPAFDPNQPYEVGPTEAQSAVRQGASGLTAGFDDELIGGVGAVGRVFGIENLGSWRPFDEESKLEYTDEPLSANELVEAYRKNRDEIRKQQKADFAVNPKTSIAASIGGAIASPLGKLRVAKEAKLAKDATSLQKAANLGARTVNAGAQGALYGAGLSDSDLTKGELGEFASDTATGAAVSAAFPPAIEAAKIPFKAAGKASKKLFLSVFGVSEKNADKYLSNRSKINRAPELEAIKDQVDDIVKQYADDVDNGKMSVAEAKKSIVELKQGLKFALQDAKIDSKDAVRQADDLFKEASAKLIQPLKDKRAPTELASQVVGSIDDLKSEVSRGSGKAVEVLSSSNKKMPKKIFKDAINHGMDSVKINGKVVGSKAESTISSLEKLSNQLDELPDDISMKEVKKIIQSLDKDISYKDGAGQFLDAASEQKSMIRQTADKFLKENIPEYAKAMRPVAEKTKLLSKMAKEFGDERKAIGRLGQVAGTKGKLDRQALSQLEKATGKEGQFTGQIDDYVKAQKLLKNPKALEEMKRALPEYKTYRQAMAKLAKMNPKWTRKQLENALATSKEARTLARAEEKLLKAQREFDDIAMFNKGSETKLRSFLKPAGPKIDTRRALEALDKKAGTNFVEQLEQRAVLDSFSKGNPMGSRNTFLWSVIGFLTGGLPGAGGGAGFGAAMDRYGPRTAKAILDVLGRIRENPSFIKTVQKMKLPDEVKKDIELALRIYLVNENVRGNK